MVELHISLQLPLRLLFKSPSRFIALFKASAAFARFTGFTGFTGLKGGAGIVPGGGVIAPVGGIGAG
jgi:hypothetical protein